MAVSRSPAGCYASAADAANFHITRTPVDLAPIVASVADLAAGAADMAGIDLHRGAVFTVRLPTPGEDQHHNR